MPIINDKVTFIILSFLTRSFQGLFFFFILSHGYSDVVNYTRNEEKLYIKYIGFIETAVYIGMFSGPLFGGVFTKLMGYGNMLYLLSFLIFISMITDLIEQKFYFHNVENFFINDLKENTRNNYKIFNNLYFVGIFCLGAFNVSNLYVINSGFAINMKNTLKIPLEESSMIFSIFSITGCITSFFYGWINWKIGKELHIQIGSLLIALGLLLIGPASFLPSNIILIVFGLAFLGVGGTFGSLSLIAIFKDHLTESEEDYNSNEIENLSGSFYSIIWSIGGIFGYVKLRNYRELFEL